MFKLKYFKKQYLLYKQRLISIFPFLYIILKNGIYFKKTIIDLKGYRAIKKNVLFDEEYYLNKNQDVSKGNIDPVLHYMFKGFKEGRDPSFSFNGKYYLKKYKDVKKTGLNPLIHYSLYGINENRSINNQSNKKIIIKRNYDLIVKSGLFDKKWYNNNYGLNIKDPIMHYLKKNSNKELNPNPLFDSKWYLRNNRDSKIKDPFLHFIVEGASKYLDPHPLFSISHYISESPTIDSNINPLRDYIENGRFNSLTPSSIFRIDKKVLSSLPNKFKYKFTSSPILSRVETSVYLGPFLKGSSKQKFTDFESYLRKSTTKKALINSSLNKADMDIIVMMDKQKKILFDKYKNRSQNELISIIMPTSNRAEVIADSIISVISQSYKNWELIIIDDGGSDNTEQAVNEFNDKRIIYHKLKSNFGSSFARNKGLSISRGSIIAYLDDDDLWDPDMLIISVNALRDSGKKSLYSAQIVWDGFNSISRIGNKFKYILFTQFNLSLLENSNYISMISFVHDRSLIETVGIFNESLRGVEDWDFILKCVEKEFPVAIPCILSHYFSGRCGKHVSSSKNILKSVNNVYNALIERSSWRKKIVFNDKNCTLFGMSEVAQEMRLKKLLKLPKEKVNIIIQHLENNNALFRCVESIKKNTLTEYDILVCDTSSENEYLLNELSALFKHFQWIKTDEIRGSYKINEKIKKVFEEKKDIVILDSDTIVTPNWLEELRVVLKEDNNVAVAVPRQVIVENNNIARLHSPDSDSNFDIDISLSDYHDNVLGKYKEEGMYELKFTYGACALMRYNDLFSAKFSTDECYGDISLELLYSDLLRHTGKKIVYTPYSKVYHLQNEKIAMDGNHE